MLSKEPLELVVFVGDTVSVHELPGRGEVTIGRAESNGVRIQDGSVSREHAVLHIGERLYIEDKGSANGTYVRDPGEDGHGGETYKIHRQPGETYEVRLGDCIMVGSTMAVVRRASSRGQEREAGGLASLAGDTVVCDKALQEVYEEAYGAARGTMSILLLGETGVGKEVLAREIHRRSPRARGPFVAIHCASLPEQLIEGELFGYEKGAFTDAAQRVGLLETAQGGTVFLDEVGELPPGMQVKLLRVLETHEILRLGARTARKIDVRFVSATNRDLDKAVAEGTFRKDLFYRLNGFVLTIPPLRERKRDIAPLCRLFLTDACQKLNRDRVIEVSDEALGLLERYAWPGNVRELRHVIDRACVLCAGDTLLGRHLPSKLIVQEDGDATEKEERQGQSGRGVDSMAELRASMAKLEYESIVEALSQCGGNQTQAAKKLGKSRRWLVDKLEEYHLPRPRKPS